MFKKVLISNRGEIARRIIRTLKRMNIKSVAVYSDSDANAPHVFEADEAVWIGPDPATQSYLDIEKIVAAAQKTGAEAIHPGYGFLAESTNFAKILKENGIALIGPDEHALEVMGDKARSKDHVSQHGVPVVPGFNAAGMSDAEIIVQANEVGYPLLIKPSAGGGGKGMEIAHDQKSFETALASARRIALAAFADDTLIIEKLIAKPRHIEVQIFGDEHGNVFALGERECTLQRRHQKVIEEAPSVAISESTRQELFTAAINAAKSVAYVGAGTVEFLIDADKPSDFFFIEMNTRLQVEHPVTEEVTGLDLVELQVLVAAGQELRELNKEPVGYAVEARIYAESPANDFMPSIGEISKLKFGAGVRIDSAVDEGSAVSPFYDPMIAKIIAHAPTREEALRKLDKVLAETTILGVETNIEFLRSLLANENVQAGELDTGLIGRLLPFEAKDPSASMLQLAAETVVNSGAANGADLGSTSAASPVWAKLAGFRLGGSSTEQNVWLQDDSGKVYAVSVAASDSSELTADSSEATAESSYASGHVWISEDGVSARFKHLSRRDKTLLEISQRATGDSGEAPECFAPMPGTVVILHVADGSEVQKGDPIVSIEAMKMEHPVTARTSGVVRLETKIGAQVQKGALVARVEG